jgi:hypothetical protein
MATTTNYAWTTPDNSGLVKNGAQDIRTLGSAVDTALWNSGYGQAGKNKLINADFFWNQRNFTSNTTTGLFNFDRWFQSNSGGTFTVTPQSFTLGAAPVAGYESKTFVQGITASQSAASDYAWFGQKIESVRTFAGQTATISFWAKAGSGTPKIAVELSQFFGSGGSPSASVNTYAGQVTLSTSWARYSVTVAVPSISGKTLGTANDDHLRLNLMVSAGTDYNARSGSLGVQNNTFQLWGVQVEYGSTATPFQTATGTIQGELAACQRYFIDFTGNTGTYGTLAFSGSAFSTTQAFMVYQLPVVMRTGASITTSGTINLTDGVTSWAVTSFANAQIATTAGGASMGFINATVASGLTQYRPLFVSPASTARIQFSAEL